MKRLTSRLCLLATLVPLLGGDWAAYAQQGYYPQDRRAYPPGYYPGKLVQPAQPQQQQGFSLRRLFGIQDQVAPPPPETTRRRVPPSVRRDRPRQAPSAAPAAAAVARQEKPKTDAATQIVLFGDALAEFAGQGLETIYEDNPDVGVVRKVKGEAGLVRTDLVDWPKYIRETLDGGQKTTIAVVMMGANDRQSIKEGGEAYDVLSDSWEARYRQRVDAVMQVFKERSIPVVWVGIPPLKSDKLSEDLIGMNEIVRESVQRLGGTYVDIWPGFVDEDNHYATSGPDVEGQTAKLRTNDGVFFTKAGSRKVAHFANEEIKHILEVGKAEPPAATVSTDGTENGEISLEAALPPPPDPVGLPAIPSKPLIGPVLPLSNASLSPGGTLVTKPPRMDTDNAYPIQRTLRNGIAPSPQPGRADDFRWPPS